ncbi:hypothetical protein TcasGA2_TC000019 [Tribolium castaneum]|uniref:Uncharacterized protein n=1 Tax=Tribolium castaneum TaxID=7070 RepID=D6WUL9_TRICA|nr:hypothetical protein TcasGA2_TC006144 [Tribolium castaneum]EFA13505.1 hypothetical protein TcasGA2_TC000019 [Tribolium castaneum]
MSSVEFKNLNKDVEMESFVSIKSIKVDEKFCVKAFKKVATKFGTKVMVDCEGFSSILPHRFTDRLNDEQIGYWNEKIKSGNIKLFMVSKGPMGNTTKIEFFEE